MAVRVLIVDDSPSIQAILKYILEDDPEIEVAGTASNPYEARTMIKELPVDVVTLDVEMPGMNGLEFLEKIMTLRPMPVVMISTLTDKGTAASVQALAMGAVNCLPKPRIDDQRAIAEIREVVKEAASAKVRKREPSPMMTAKASLKPATSVSSAVTRAGQPDLILIGASTGGVEALSQLLASFPQDCPPTVITQHMLSGFTRSFCEHLNQGSAPQIAEAVDQGALERGHVYIAPSGGGHTTVTKDRGTLRTRVRVGEPRSGHMPSVDELFCSGAKLRGMSMTAAILTGMGRDGADGMLELKNCGVKTIAQDENTCLIFGMPRSAIRMNAVNEILPLTSIGEALLNKHNKANRNAA